MSQQRDEIVEMVREDLLARSRFGLKKYGRGLDTRQDFTLRDWLQHQYEELLDAANYTKCAILKLDGHFPPTISDAVRRIIARADVAGYDVVGEQPGKASRPSPIDPKGDGSFQGPDERDGRPGRRSDDDLPVVHGMELCPKGPHRHEDGPTCTFLISDHRGIYFCLRDPHGDPYRTDRCPGCPARR